MRMEIPIKEWVSTSAYLASEQKEVQVHKLMLLSKDSEGLVQDRTE